MTRKNQPIILTSEQPEQAENDCACVSQPQVFVSCENTALSVEDDCACIPSTSNYSGQTVYSTWERTPRLYRRTLPGKNELVFNPFGNNGMVVLNESARQLLDAFDQPIRVEDFPVSFPNQPLVEIDMAARKLFASGLLTPTGKCALPVKSFPQTLTAWLHVTNACNLRCDYCYLQKTPEKLDLERGKQAIEAVFRSAELNGFENVKIKYAGGEATLQFGLILELHDYAQSLARQGKIGLTGVVLSNGVSITEYMLQALKERGLHLSISLDGIGNEHDSQRKFLSGRGSFDLVERSLNQMEANHFKPSVTITVSNRNLHGLSKVVEYVLKREMPFTINFYRESNCSAAFSDLSYDDDELIRAMRESFAIIEANLPAFSLLGILTDRARLDFSHDRPCGVGNSYLVIDQNGKIAKCHMEIEKSVTDISSSDPLKKIQMSQVGVQNLSVDEKEGCRDCTWRYWCAGGCPLLTYRVTGRYDVKSPSCRIYQALFPEVLRLEGLRLLKHAGGKQ
jgi:uncharacterized protein